MNPTEVLSLTEARDEMRRLSRLIDRGIQELRGQSLALAEAECVYRKAKSEAWVRCPNDDSGVKAGEREWTAARREAWVNAETADLRRDRDRAESMRDVAREAVRARRQQLSSWQTLVNAHEEEAGLARTGPEFAA